MEKYFTNKQVAKMFNVSRQTVNAWVKTGRLKGIKLSGPHGTFKFSESAIQEMINTATPS